MSSSTITLPTHHNALILQPPEGSASLLRGVLTSQPVPSLKFNEVLIKIHSVALNHKDVWILKGYYPRIKLGAILGADCFGTVVAPKTSPWFSKKVVVYPAINWDSDRQGPETGKLGILGGTDSTDGLGVFQNFLAINEANCVEAPKHLIDGDQSIPAGLPLAGLTAWRALITKGEAKEGSHILITGIGGGVAIFALQFAVALGCKVWVTSSSKEKIEKAVKLGAEGGVNYKDEDWPEQLAKLLPATKPTIDVVIDSSGDDIVQKCNRAFLRDGSRIVCYGNATGKSVTVSMFEILRNIEFRGTTMGSLAEFKEMVKFVEKHKLIPVISQVFQGLEKFDAAIDVLDKGSQFGKVVMKL